MRTRLWLYIVLLTGTGAVAQRSVVLVTDCGNWVDDQIAIVQLLASTDVSLKGIVATQYGAPDTNRLAFDSVKSLLSSLDASIPVWLGGGSSLTGEGPIESEGARKLVELAERGTLHVLCLAAATDVASAIRMSDKAAANMRVTWVGGGPLPKGGRGDFNLANDVPAARVLMNSAVSLTWVPAVGVADGIKMTGKEIRDRFGGFGKVGKALTGVVAAYEKKSATLWDVAAVGVFLRPAYGTTETQGAPDFNDDYNILPRKSGKSIVIYTKIRPDAVLAEFTRSVQLWGKSLGSSSPGG